MMAPTPFKSTDSFDESVDKKEPGVVAGPPVVAAAVDWDRDAPEVSNSVLCKWNFDQQEDGAFTCKTAMPKT